MVYIKILFLKCFSPHKDNTVFTDALWYSRCLHQLSLYCFWSPNSSFAYSVITWVALVDIFLFSACMMLTLVYRGCWRDSRKRGLLILVLVCLASQAPADHVFIPWFFKKRVIFYKNPTSQLGFCLISSSISTIFQHTFHLV